MRKTSPNPCRGIYVSSAPAGDVGFFKVAIKLCGTSGREQQGLSTTGSCREILHPAWSACRTTCACWWSQLNFEIWACLKLKLESKPPGRKQCELSFFFSFLKTLQTKSTLCSQLQIKSSSRWASLRKVSWLRISSGIWVCSCTQIRGFGQSCTIPLWLQTPTEARAGWEDPAAGAVPGVGRGTCLRQAKALAGGTGDAMGPGLQCSDLQVPNSLPPAPLPALLMFIETS